MRRAATTDPPSARLARLVAGDLPGHKREAGEGGRLRFVPIEGGPALEVSGRTERRFLGRTEIAVFESIFPAPIADSSTIEIKHSGRLKRSGLVATVKTGGEASMRLAEAIAADGRLAEVSLPRDFTSFEVSVGTSGCRARVELMGASHVAIALPPIRSYVHLHPDQRESLIDTLVRLGEVLQEHAGR